MIAVIQRVSSASCQVDEEYTGKIKKGLLVFVGFDSNDTQIEIEKMVKKIVHLRIFSDQEDKMNLSLLDIGGEILSISQFTLYADCKKGNRPSFIKAAKPILSKPLYEAFNLECQKYVTTKTGIFGADMKIELTNDGPVTIVLNSEELF
ncbi:D-aminoacyl-tRNA deacylase [Dubosiella newyorkensis]|jgi:D-tyrosyl-tRNA(Tyr) deacylase|uniref:D-aminoacyl-tRNA deacylase n=2 Tax=Dubosiella newyorkensis TaxID=1862672 RepID=UPI002357E8F0|nr:D-aminoacyl-tRNA deacylase [Dubosiella newyorkensis]MCI9042060.1 D-tyrosyl-tRNA(Tyr) deacylase [Dubosiella newyorkensis]